MHTGVELRANLKSISHRCHLFEVAFVWELTKETIHLPLGCLQGGSCKADLYGVMSKCRNFDSATYKSDMQDLSATLQDRLDPHCFTTMLHNLGLFIPSNNVRLCYASCFHDIKGFSAEARGGDKGGVKVEPW